MSEADAKIIENLKKSGLYDALAAQVGGTAAPVVIVQAVNKDATAADVHVAAAGGDEKKKPRPAAGAKLFTDKQPSDEPDGKPVKKADDAFSFDLSVAKMVPTERMVFGWASVSQINDEEIIDKQGDIVPIDALEKGAYEFVLTSRAQGDMHASGDDVAKAKQVGRLVESMVFTPEKAKLGVVAKNQAGETIYGWWTGFHVDSDPVWAAHLRGDRPEFSIGGRASSEAA